MTTEETISSTGASAPDDKGTDLAGAYHELMKAEKAASALEAMLDNIDSKLDDILSDETFLAAEAALRQSEAHQSSK
ncbi:hypothetical protein POJ06DRAFT_270298 [Lipomyces tetrasporus]|uniref:Uncharacterized protein n=1 Tax=Lipomyces tetrasporus TaxID=54092 RepID=A0AAD7QNL7_9ASCO|nr:uncharacterized protein POJ06DRAFT_270298 [Lipomyces tetrasporus]KAJ8098325.1 hypothetical protein POJ06DRAFT_270298 [Lipomyces tetrasporus]